MLDATQSDVLTYGQNSLQRLFRACKYYFFFHSQKATLKCISKVQPKQRLTMNGRFLSDDFKLGFHLWRPMLQNWRDKKGRAHNYILKLETFGNETSVGLFVGWLVRHNFLKGGKFHFPCTSICPPCVLSYRLSIF